MLDRSTSRIIITATFVSVVLLSGCGGGGESESANGGMGGVDLSGADRDLPGSNFVSNNSARLTGPVIGTNTRDNQELRYTIPFTVESPNSDIEVRQFYITRENNLSHFVALLKNKSTSSKCAVRVNGATMFDTAGVGLSEEVIIANGSIGGGTTGSGRTCIPPGGLVYATVPSGIQYGIVQSTTIESISSMEDEISNAMLIPLSYAIDGTSVNVLVANQGAVPIQIFSTWRVILLSDDGTPVKVTVTLEEGEIPVLQPGSEFNLVSDPIVFDGSITTIRPVVDYFVCTPDSTTTCTLTIGSSSG